MLDNNQKAIISAIRKANKLRIVLNNGESDVDLTSDKMLALRIADAVQFHFIDYNKGRKSF